MVRWQQCVREMPATELFTPAWLHLHDADVILHEVRAVKIAAAIEKHFASAVKSIDQIPAEKVRGKDSRFRGQRSYGFRSSNREDVCRKRSMQPKRHVKHQRDHGD